MIKRLLTTFSGLMVLLTLLLSLTCTSCLRESHSYNSSYVIQTVSSICDNVIVSTLCLEDSLTKGLDSKDLLRLKRLKVRENYSYGHFRLLSTSKEGVIKGQFDIICKVRKNEETRLTLNYSVTPLKDGTYDVQVEWV